MAHIKPTTRDSDSSCAADGKFLPFKTAVELSAGGFGVKRIDGTFEILDALPGNNPKFRNSSVDYCVTVYFIVN